MTVPYPVLIIEDTPAAAKLMAELIKTVIPRAQICHQPTLQQALNCLNDQPWQLFLVDLGLPDGSGISFIEQARPLFATVPFIVMTVFDDDDNLFGALAAGATGYLLKSQPKKQLTHQLALLHEGHVPMSPSIARRLLQHFQMSKPRPAAPLLSGSSLAVTPKESLTTREKQVLAAIARGLQNREVASLLGLTEQTVSTYIRNLYTKLNINNRAQATLAAQRHGLL